jgi:ferredoxin-NADP reductase
MSSEPTTYLVKLKNRFPVAERTMAFQFEKPENFVFRPGQWIDITLLNPAETDAEGNVRGFSIASAPYEDMLMVATRMRDTAFKRELGRVPLNTEVKISGPGGNLTLQNNSARTAVFLAGGIGVTPIRSILFHAAKQRLPHRILFFFSNRRPEDAPFLEELQALQQQNPNYTFIATMTQMATSNREWTGQTGYINKDMLAKYLSAANLRSITSSDRREWLTLCTARSTSQGLMMTTSGPKTLAATKQFIVVREKSAPRRDNRTDTKRSIYGRLYQ